MPAKYTLREFAENQYYHVFNRGIEKRNIFQDDQDFNMFLYYLNIYLSPINTVLLKYPTLPIHLQKANLSSENKLLCYCLMPNHFHLLIKQITANGVSKLMKQVLNAYVGYFNRKYRRTGALFQGRYRAVLIESEEQLLHVSRYIHLNPIVSGITKDLRKYRWSSHNCYINESINYYCSKEIILEYFRKPGSYEKFVLDNVEYGMSLERIKHLVIDCE